MKAQLYKQRFLNLISIFLLIIFINSKSFSQGCDCNDELVAGATQLVSSDGFETYPLNGFLPVGGYWSLYPASSGYTPASGTIVNNPLECGSKALKLQITNNQPVDIRYELSGIKTTIRMYVPSNKSARIAYLDDNNNTLTQIVFGTGNTATIDGGFPSSFTYPKNTWFRFSTISINSEYTAFFIDYENVSSTTLDYTSGYLNLYSNLSNDLFYVDKMCQIGVGCCITCSNDYNPVCLNYSNIEAGDNGCYAMSKGFLPSEFQPCFTETSCGNATPIECGETISSTTIGETFKFYRPDYGSCLTQGAVDFRAPDKVFSFYHTGGDVGIHLWGKTLNVDLDIFLLDQCGVGWCGTGIYVVLDVPPDAQPTGEINCIASGASTNEFTGYDNDFIEYQNLPAGSYYIVVDGQHWQETGQNDDVGDFDLSLTCGYLNCNNPTPIYCNVPLNNITSYAGQNNVSVYCSPNEQGSGSTNPLPIGSGCTGNERVFSYTAISTGQISIELTGINSNEDFELFLLSGCDHRYCLASSTNTFGEQEIINYDVQAGNTYQIVVDGYQQSEGNYNLLITCCGTPTYNQCGINGPINYYYSGDGNNLKYTFTSDEQIASGYEWIIKQDGNVTNEFAGTNTSTTITFPNPGFYEICFPFINLYGCLEYCCFPVNIGNPFECNDINYSFNSNSNSFNFTAQTSGTNAIWLADNGNNPPTTLPGGSIPVPGNCIARTISYRYFDGTYWRYCCKVIWICNPFTCGNDGNIQYSFNANNQFQFTLKDANQYSNISWQVDGASPIDIGNGGSVNWFPGAGQDCKTYPITVRYFDANCNCWRICCRYIYVCNPFTCGDISFKYKPLNNEYTFSLNGSNSNYNNFSWTIDETNTNIGNSKVVNYIPPANTPCKVYTYSLRYWDGSTWRLCCIPIYICDPSSCQSDINYTYVNNSLTLSTNNPHAINVIWYLNNNEINAISNQSSGDFEVVVLYYDSANKYYRTCKKLIQLTSATEDYGDKSTIVYPNPANDIVHIKSSNEVKAVSLFNMSGKMTLATKSNNEIDVSSLTPGIYIMKIETTKGISIHKLFVIQ